MIAENLGEFWYEESGDYKRRRRQKKYSDLVIEQFIKIRCLFGLRLRQTEGFINYLFELCGLNIKSPDYTTVSKRSKTLGLPMVLIESDEEFDYLSMDSTGIQTFTGNKAAKEMIIDDKS